MTDDALRQAEIQAREQAATKGPWSVVTGSGGAYVKDVMSDATGDHVVCWGHDYDDYGSMSVEDARFCAHARQDIPWLLQRLAQVEQEDARLNASVGELLQSVSARESEARQAREAMQSLDVFYVEKRQQLESALAAARQEMADLEAKWREKAHDDRLRADGYRDACHSSSSAYGNSVARIDCADDLAAARLRASEDGTRTTDEDKP